MKITKYLVLLYIFLVSGIAWCQASPEKVIQDIDAALDALIKAGNQEVLKIRDAINTDDPALIKPIPLSNKKLDSKTLNSALNESHELIQAGQYDQALSKLKAAGPENDPSGKLFNNMAVCYERIAGKCKDAGQFADALNNSQQTYLYAISAKAAGKNTDEIIQNSIYDLMYFSSKSNQPLLTIAVGKSAQSNKLNAPALINAYINLNNSAVGDLFVYFFLNALKDTLAHKLQPDLSTILASHWIDRQLVLNDKRTIPFLSSYCELLTTTDLSKVFLLKESDFLIYSRNWPAAIKTIELYLKQSPDDENQKSMLEILAILKDHSFTASYTISFDTSAKDDKTVDIGIEMPIPLLSTVVGSIEVSINGKLYKKFKDMGELSAIKEGELHSVSKEPAGLLFILSLKADRFSVGKNEVQVRVLIKKTRTQMSADDLNKWKLTDYKPDQALNKIGLANNKNYQLSHGSIQKPIFQIRQLGQQVSLYDIIKKAYDDTLASLEYDDGLNDAVKNKKPIPPFSLDRSSGGKGVCLDYALRMASILRAVGIPAWVVTGQISTSSLGHAWVMIALPDGRFVYSDPTYGDTGWKKYDVCLVFDANERFPENIITDNDVSPMTWTSRSKTLFQNPVYSILLKDTSTPIKK